MGYRKEITTSEKKIKRLNETNVSNQTNQTNTNLITENKNQNCSIFAKNKTQFLNEETNKNDIWTILYNRDEEKEEYYYQRPENTSVRGNNEEIENNILSKIDRNQLPENLQFGNKRLNVNSDGKAISVSITITDKDGKPSKIIEYDMEGKIKSINNSIKWEEQPNIEENNIHNEGISPKIINSGGKITEPENIIPGIIFPKDKGIRPENIHPKGISPEIINPGDKITEPENIIPGIIFPEGGIKTPGITPETPQTPTVPTKPQEVPETEQVEEDEPVDENISISEEVKELTENAVNEFENFGYDIDIDLSTNTAVIDGKEYEIEINDEEISFKTDDGTSLKYSKTTDSNGQITSKIESYDENGTINRIEYTRLYPDNSVQKGTFTFKDGIISGEKYTKKTPDGTIQEVKCTYDENGNTNSKVFKTTHPDGTVDNGHDIFDENGEYKGYELDRTYPDGRIEHIVYDENQKEISRTEIEKTEEADKVSDERHNDAESYDYDDTSRKTEITDNIFTTKNVQIGDDNIEFQITDTGVHGEGYEIAAINNGITRGIGSVFGANFDTKDGEIDNTKQGQTNDCWILSAINALSYSEEGKECIKESLEYKDGYTIVHFKGGAGDYIVTDEEILATRGTLQYSSGDMDMVIFEIAVEKFRNDLANGNVIFDSNIPSDVARKPDETSSSGIVYLSDSSIDGGQEAQLLYLLTGKVPEENILREDYEKYLNKLKEGNCAITFAATSEIKDINGKKVFGGGDAHAFSVKSFDGENVTIVNPWDSSKEIVISLEEFTNKAAKLQVVDLSKDNPEKELITRNDAVTTTIDGKTYNAKILKQNDGEIVSGVILDDNSNYGIQFDEDGSLYVVSYNEKTKSFAKMFSISKDEYKEALAGGLENYAENREIKETDKNGVNSTYRIINGKKLLLKAEKNGKSIEKTYDENGNLTSEIKFDKDGNKIKTEYSYFGDMLTQGREYKYNEETGEYELVCTIEDYIYEEIDGENVVKEARRYYEDGSGMAVETYKYDNVDGILTKTETIRKEYGILGVLGGVKQRTETTYQSFDNCYYVTVYDENNNKKSVIKYDAAGNMIYIQEYNEDGTTTVTRS